MNHRIILNIDIISATGPFLERVLDSGTVTEEALYPFVDQYIDLPNGAPTGLMAIAFNTFCQFESIESRCMSTFAEVCDRYDAAGKSIDLIEHYYKPFVRLYREYGIDPWDVFIRRCRTRGYESWVSVRMNDAHDNDYEEFLMDTFAYRAKWKDHAIGDRYGYYWKCLDYAHDEVRERFLGYIEEQLDRYDMDALELDFMREIWCFDYMNNPDCCAIMTQFMRDVRARVTAAEAVRGHKIRLSVRLPREIEQCRVWGFDVAAWDAESLVDHITVTPRWSSSDSDMPIEEWVRRFPHIEIAAGVETLLRFDDLRTPEGDAVNLDAAAVNGLAAAYYAQGAAQINLYNYFCCPPMRGKNTAPKTLHPVYDRTVQILTHCSDEETVRAYPRRHMVMYQDIVPEGYQPYKPLPITVENGAAASVRVPTGPIPDGKRVLLILTFAQGGPDTTSVEVNGTSCTGFVPYDTDSLIETAEGRLVILGNACFPKGCSMWACEICPDGASEVQTVSFRSDHAVINHVEIRIGD